jgi:acetate---CoA ligase (ADP-forming)
MKRELDILFNPKSIAIIGASEEKTKVGGILMTKALKSYAKIIPINPKHPTIFKKKSYKSILEYEEEIDLAVIAIPSKFVEKTLEECGKKKIKNIIIISAGFSEIGNTKQEKKLVEIAKKYKINILGPNCFGIANPSKNLDLTFANNSQKKGDIAFVSQSGALWSYLSDLELKKGFSKFLSLGNMSDINFADAIQYLNKDPQTKKIVLYIEKLKQGRKFLEVSKKSKKEIIAVKVGKTQGGKYAALSHTGSLASDFEIYKGVFKQAKIRQTFSLGKTLGLKIKLPRFKNIKKAFILTNAGGAGGLLTDYLESKNIDVIEKPLDILGTATAKEYKQALEKIKNKKANTIFITLTPQTMSQPLETAKQIIQFKKSNPKKKIICVFLGKKSFKKSNQLLRKNKIKVINYI